MLTEEQRIKNLQVPTGDVDVVMDTDAAAEIDDQFAIAYMFRSPKLHVKAMYAAPFPTDPKPNMELSFLEIQKMLSLLREDVPVFRGAEGYLPDAGTPVVSDAARDLVRRALCYSPENPLYVIAIGTITNVASAILLEPKVADNTVVIWLGGHAHHYPDTNEFNMRQDIHGARVVMGCGVPFVQLPCRGVVDVFSTTRPELEFWLRGKNPAAEYLLNNTIRIAEIYAKVPAWSRTIWDVTAVAWLLNEDDRFMSSSLVPTPEPTFDNRYAQKPDAVPMRYVYQIKRDALMNDLFQKLTK